MVTKAIPLAHQYIPNLLKVTLVKSMSKCNPDVRACLAALGMQKINKHRYHKNTPQIRGMIFRAAKYVHISEIPLPEGETTTPATPSNQ